MRPNLRPQGKTTTVLDSQSTLPMGDRAFLSGHDAAVPKDWHGSRQYRLELVATLADFIEGANTGWLLAQTLSAGHLPWCTATW